jgi:tyrosine-protein kinase Etk/Wzc
MNNTTYIEEKESHLYDYIEVLLRRKWVIIVFFITVVAAVAIITYNMTPIYESTATILIEEQRGWEAPTILTEFTGLKPSKIQSEIEVIKSRTIAEKVVKKLQYDVKVFDSSRNLFPQLTNITIPDRLINKTFVVEFQDKERFIVISNGSKVGSGSIGHPLNSNIGLSFTIKKANAENGASFKIKKISFSKAVNQLMTNTTVSPIRNTNVVKISTRNSNKQMAADMANSIVKFYREHDIKARSQQASQVIQFIEKQIGPAQEKVDRSMSALAEYKSRSDVTDIKEGTRALIQNVAELEKQKAELIVKKYQINSLYNEIQESTSFISPSALSFLRDPVVQDMISRLSVLESKRKSFLTDYTERHPQVIALSAEINELRKKANSSIKNILKSLNTKIVNLSLQIKRFKNQLKKLPDKEKELADLIRNAETNSRLHKFLLEKLNEANIMYASTLSQMQIIDKAVASNKPVKPKTMLNIILAIIVGLTGGIGLAFFVDYLDNSIKSPHDVEKYIGLPIFGRIPYIPSNKIEFFRTNEIVHSNPTGLITLESTKSITAESFRLLRTNLQFAVMEKRGKVLHLTSPEASEGKTTIAANLGITLALMGSKTLIIDTDLRKPKIHHIFGVNKEPGITHLLTNRKTTLRKILRTTEIKHLYVIPVGIIPPNPSELLSQENLSNFLNEMRAQFDYILLDSPPVLPITDAQLLGRLADATFIVIELGETKLPAAEHAINQLRNVNVNVAGAIINKIKPSTGYGYYDYNYYYYYYSDETGKKKPSSKLKFWKKT